MPLYKRNPFQLLEPPKDLVPDEPVFQIRFTNEIFRDYQEYIIRLNLYSQRVWTCNITGKTGLTYEEALVMECAAIEKAKKFPKKLMAPVFHMIQYSTLSLKVLVDVIYYKLQENLYEGVEMHGKKEQCLCLCRILRNLEDGRYKVGWLDNDREVTDSSIVNAEDLIHKKPPVSRSMLRAFVRESTFKSAPWVVHEELAKKHGVSIEPPEKLIEEEKLREEMINYPIDDLLVKSAADDLIYANRPSPYTDFRVPMDCVGDLLMVWNFCSSFSRLLNLWPFSLEDFENAICHRDSSLVLIVESHSAILRLLIKEEGDYFLALRNKKRKLKITLTNWSEYLCDFLEMKNRSEFTHHLNTIRRDHYGLLDYQIKLGIFGELVTEAVETHAIREKISESIERRQALEATKREQVRKRREEQDLKEKSDTKETNHRHVENTEHLPDEDSTLTNEKRKHDGGSLSNVLKKFRTVNGSHMDGVVNFSGMDGSKGQRRGKVNKETGEKKTEEWEEHLEREMDKLSIRTNYLGKDRNYNRYWFFRRERRLFVESSDSKQWGYYTSKEELDALIASLNPKGERERALKKQLEKFYHRMSTALQKRSKDIAHRILLEEAVVRRSTRVRAQPRDSQAMAFIRYVNKWKEN